MPGIHQKGGPVSSSALISGEDGNETDTGVDSTPTTTVSNGVDVVVNPIKLAFTAL